MRFFRRGITKVHFLPAVAVLAAPTRAEISAGDNVTADLAEINGFNKTNSAIATPDMNTRFTKNIVGEDTTDASSLIFYDQDNSEVIRDALADGTAGYLVFMPYGDVAAKRAEVWPVRTAGVNDEFSTGSEAARFAVQFSVTDEPEQDAVIPALV